ncbi:MAG TPA: hypothetical protein VKJ47_13215 [Candidatus Binatia bacterium]|nr:hypothetical protein [Candidatus Binatia bacterium]
MKPDDPVPLSPEADPSAAWAPVFRSLGLPSYRVRVEGRIACIAAPPEDFVRLLDPVVRPVLLAHGKALGYLFVTLDMG